MNLPASARVPHPAALPESEEHFTQLLESLDSGYRKAALGLFARMVDDLSAVPPAAAEAEFRRLLDPALTDAERFARLGELSYRYRQRRPTVVESLRLSDLRASEKLDALMQATGGSVDLAGARRALGDVSRQAVEKRMARGTLLWASVAGQRRFPLAQFEPGGRGVHRQVAAVMRRLGVHSPVDRLVFFLAPKRALDGARPIDLLRRGERVEEIARQAALYLGADVGAL